MPFNAGNGQILLNSSGLTRLRMGHQALYIAPGGPPLSLLQGNQQRLAGLVEKMDGAVKWPGIRVFQEWIIVARST